MAMRNLLGEGSACQQSNPLTGMLNNFTGGEAQARDSKGRPMGAQHIAQGSRMGGAVGGGQMSVSAEQQLEAHLAQGPNMQGSQGFQPAFSLPYTAQQDWAKEFQGSSLPMSTRAPQSQSSRPAASAPQVAHRYPVQHQMGIGAMHGNPMPLGMHSHMHAPPPFMASSMHSPLMQNPVAHTGLQGSQGVKEGDVKQEQQPIDVDAAKRMVAAMKTSGNAKFEESRFVDFVDKLNKGELKIDNDTVVGSNGEAINFEDIYETSNLEASGESDFDFGIPNFMEGMGEDDAFQLEEIWEQLKQHGMPDSLMEDLNGPTNAPYEFREVNRFMEGEKKERLLEVALQLLREGRDHEAMLALEAEVQHNPNSSEGWRFLGQLHAAMDRDFDAIVCLEKAHAVDPSDLESLLALGVSLTNELDSYRALKILRRWIQEHPKFKDILAVSDLPKLDTDKNYGMLDYDLLRSETLELFESAVEAHHTDPDLHVALGVMYNIARDFGKAVDALSMACRLRPMDFQSWNKLGATLANAGFSQQAVGPYQMALQLKPTYARAWSNLAIAHGNLGEMETSCNFYAIALQLSPQAEHLWTLLFNAFASWRKDDEEVGRVIEAKDLGALLRLPYMQSVPSPSALQKEGSTPPEAREVERVLREVYEGMKQK